MSDESERINNDLRPAVARWENILQSESSRGVKLEEKIKRKLKLKEQQEFENETLREMSRVLNGGTFCTEQTREESMMDLIPLVYNRDESFRREFTPFLTLMVQKSK